VQMINCPNCGKLTGFKRSLGFGTFFMVLITCGLWLLVIPFYPARCITCGLTRHSAVLHEWLVWYRGLSRTSRYIIVGLFVVLLVFSAHRKASEPKTSATSIDNSPAVSNVSNDESPAAAPVAPHIYGVTQINESKNDIPTGTELTAQGTFYQSGWWPFSTLITDPCTNLLQWGKVRVEHGKADPRTYCRFFVVLHDEHIQRIASLECIMSLEEFKAAHYTYGNHVQAHGTYASSLDFDLYGGTLGGVPVLEDCTLAPLPPRSAPQASPPSPRPPTSENIVRAINAEDSSPQNQSKPYPVDGDLESDVRRALRTSKALKSAVITPVSLHREVTLSGTVVDEPSRELAEDIASHVPGVVAVHNNLTVGGAKPQ